MLAFKESLGQRHFYYNFSTEAQFRASFLRILTNRVQALIRAESNSNNASPPQLAASEQPGVAKGGELPSNPHLPIEVVEFLKSISVQALQPIDQEPLAAEDAARFRLAASMLSPNADDQMIGVHDANTLYEHRHALGLSNKEKSTLFRAGLAHLQSENCPIWHWLSEVHGLEGRYLPVNSLFGTDPVKVGAIRLLTILERADLQNEDVERETFVRRWLSEQSHHTVREAALEYLYNYGSPGDLELVKAEVERADYQTKSSATKTFLKLLSDQNSQSALEALIELDPETINDDVVDEIFRRPELLETQSLVAATNLRAPIIRAKSVGQLSARSALSKELADQVSNDTDAKVRLQAVLARMALGETITDSMAEDILVKTAAPGRNALGGFFGFSGYKSTKQGIIELGEFRQKLRSSMSLATLRKLSAEASIFDQHLVFELISRDFKERGDELRHALEDQFKAWFSREVDKTESMGLNKETLEKIRQLENTLRAEWVRDALNVLVFRGEAGDVLIVRKLLRSAEVESTRADIDFIAKHGEWSDVSFIIDFAAKQQGGATLLSAYISQSEAEYAASALCQLGGSRIVDLLELVSVNEIRAAMIRLAPSSAIKALTDQQIGTLLQDEFDAVRRALSLRCVSDLPRARVVKIFNSHMQLEHKRYYNVTVSLDLGVSFPSKQGKRIAKRIL